MTTHDLKCWTEMFEPVWDGRKLFEIRWNDRGYQTGDIIVLREYDGRVHCEGCVRGHDPEACSRFLGRVITATVTWMAGTLVPSGGRQRGFDGNGYVVMALGDMERRPAASPVDRQRAGDAVAATAQMVARIVRAGSRGEEPTS